MPVMRHFFSSYPSIIDRYILREFLSNLLAVTLIFWLIFVATKFIRYIGKAAGGQLPGDVIFSLLGYSSVAGMTILLPLGCYLAVVLTLGRMNADSELTVMASCGLGFSLILRNVLIFSGSIAVMVGILSLNIVPDMLAERSTLEQKAEIQANTSGLIAGEFKESRDGDWVFYAEKLSEQNKDSLENIFITIQRDNQRQLVFRSQNGHFEIDAKNGDRSLVLEEGFRYEGEAGDKDFVILQFDSHRMLIEKGDDGKKSRRQKQMTTAALWARGDKKDLAEIQWRISGVLMTIILSCMAIKLAQVGPRKGRYAGLFPAILLYIIYSNLLGVTRAWVSKGVLAPWLGAVWVHVIMIAVLLLMLNWHKIRQYQRQKMLRR